MVEWIVQLLKQAGKSAWIVIDGGDTKRSFLKRALATASTIVGRLRHDAARRSTLPTLRPGHRRGRGQPRKYGKQRINLAKRAGQRHNWQTVKCTVYGKVTTRSYKAFLATYAPVGGMIRVVLFKEDHGGHAFFCTDIHVSAV